MKAIFLGVGLTLTSASFAQPVVIAHYPDSSDFLEEKTGEPLSLLPEAWALEEKHLTPQASTHFSSFPVKSTRLSPGENDVFEELEVPLAFAVFIIGDDALSKRWLAKHKKQLEKAQAIGFVVSVENQAALDSLQRLVPNNVLLPIEGDEWASTLGIAHYPVFINNPLSH